MGQVQGTGSYSYEGSDSNEAQNRFESSQMKFSNETLKALSKKKYDIYKLLELLEYNIKIALLEKEFDLKNKTLIDELNKENAEIEMSIRNLKQKYQKSLDDYKDFSIESKKKANNITIFSYVAFTLIILSCILLVFAIFKY